MDEYGVGLAGGDKFILGGLLFEALTAHAGIFINGSNGLPCRIACRGAVSA